MSHRIEGALQQGNRRGQAISGVIYRACWSRLMRLSAPRGRALRMWQMQRWACLFRRRAATGGEADMFRGSEYYCIAAAQQTLQGWGVPAAAAWDLNDVQAPHEGR